MKVWELIQRLDDVLPFRWTEEWDNTGLNLGNPEDDVTGIAVSLDPDIRAMEQAVGGGCNLLISHHPLLFAPSKVIDLSDSPGREIAFAVRKGLSLIALHTNWDSSPGGVSALLASSMGLQNVLPLIPSDRGAWGMGAVGDSPSLESPDVFAARMGECLGLSRVEVYGDRERPIRRLALCGGSGGALWRSALDAGADAYCTADMKYHEKKEATERGLRLFVLDHGEMEAHSLGALRGLLEENLSMPVLPVGTLPDPPMILQRPDRADSRPV